jgi:hypothetical protein
VARINDMGGMEGFALPEPEPAFAADWEAHVFAMNRARIGAGVYDLDEFRDAIERMEPAPTSPRPTTRSGSRRSRRCASRRAS